MSASDPKPRLAFLTRVVRKECRHLLTTDQRLFDQPFSAERAETLEDDPGPAIDNLDRAERLGWVDSADNWMAMRKLRNQMVHAYVEDPALLSSALETAHGYVLRLIAIAERLASEAQGRGWV